MRDCVRGLQGAWLGEETVDDWLDEIRQASRRFHAPGQHPDHYREQVWYPERFLRGAIGPG
jgi:hypothetical protein